MSISGIDFIKVKHSLCRLQVALAESERPGGLQVVARILGNVATFADGLSSR